MRTFTFDGVAVAAVTPFTKQGNLDSGLLRALVAWWISEGIEGLVLCGSTGEMAYLSVAERLEVIACGLSAARGRVPVIAGTGFATTRETLEATAGAAKLGVDAALVVTPYYYPLSDTAFVAHYEAVAQEAQLPVLLYNMPAFTGVNLRPELVERLAQVEGVVGIKDSAGNLEQLKQIVARTPPEFCALTGSFPLLGQAVGAGANGAILALANLIPAACVEVRKLAKQGNADRAQASLDTFEELQNWVKVHGIPGIKQQLGEAGHPAGFPRLPLQPLDPGLASLRRPDMLGAQPR